MAGCLCAIARRCGSSPATSTARSRASSAARRSCASSSAPSTRSGLPLIGLNFGALIGLTAGLLSFIPYVGSLTGLILSVGVAIVQFWPDWTWILATLGVFVLGQFVEGNILSPKLVGASVGLHPVWLMFALLAFGSLFGFVGLLLAVPLAAAVGVLARFGLQQYLGSNLYHGGAPAPGPAPVFPASPDALTRRSSSPSICRSTPATGARISSSAPRTKRAYALIERWPDWPDAILLLTGPRGSGKSHLAAIWADGRAWPGPSTLSR